MATSTATTTLPSPAASNRPAYLDSLFREGSQSLNRTPSLSKTPSLRSAHSSISSASASSDYRPFHSTRPLSPAYEEEADNDTSSVRSLKLQFSPRRGFKNLLHRRTYPQVKEIVDVEFPAKPKPGTTPSHPTHSSISAAHHDRRPSTRSGSLTARRPSIPKLQSSASSPKLNAHAQAQMYASKPLPAAPSLKAEELRCQPCYYFAARHCNGYVLGGGHGDACENCLAAGFFGAS